MQGMNKGCCLWLQYCRCTSPILGKKGMHPLPFVSQIYHDHLSSIVSNRKPPKAMDIRTFSCIYNPQAVNALQVVAPSVYR